METQGIGSNLYFQAAQSVAGQSAAKAQKDEKSRQADKTRKAFSSALEKSRQEFVLVKDGFPKEIAGMDEEEASIWLKDQADMAADVLKEHQTPENFAAYRRKVSQFLRYVAKNNFEVRKKQRRGLTRTGKPRDPQVMVTVINQKLDEMASWLISPGNDIHRSTLRMLARVDELKGMLVDLIAA